MPVTEPRRILGLALFCFLTPILLGAQALNEAFLRSTVLITFEAGPTKKSAGTGFFLFRPLTGDQGHVLLITNKHVLPPAGVEKSIQIRVTIGSGDKAAVRTVDIPVVGKDGKYLSTVRLHPNAGFDVAAVNVTETIVKQGIQGAWLPLDLLSTPERLKNEGITVGDEIFLLGYPNAIFDARNVSPILRTGVIATVPLEGYAFNRRAAVHRPGDVRATTARGRVVHRAPAEDANHQCSPRHPARKPWI